MKKFLLLSIFAISTCFANAYDFKDGDLYYTITSIQEQTVEVAYSSGNYLNIGGTVEVPSSASYNGKVFTVTRIGEEAFFNCANLVSVTLPSTIKEIGIKAFWNSGLRSIALNEGLVKIENQAFDGTKLASIVIPNSVTTFTGAVFCDCPYLSDVTLSENLTAITTSLFARCPNLKSITIPESVTLIGGYAFEKCTSLSSIIIPNKVTEIESYAFSGCSMLSSVTLGEAIVRINNKSFENCTKLKRIISLAAAPPQAPENFVNNVTYLDATLYVPKDYVDNYKNTSPWSNFSNIAEYNSSIINDNCTVNITGPVYYNGELVSTLTVPNGTSLNFEIQAPKGTELMSVFVNNVNITNSVVDEKYFSIVVEDFVTEIKVNCSKLLKGDFRSNGFYFEIISDNSVSVVSGVKKYEGMIEIPSEITYAETCYTVTSIGKEAFKKCSLISSITLPHTINNIGEGAFNDCELLKSIEIPDGVTNIPSFAFYDCTKLSNVKLPSNLETIEGYAFAYCYALEKIDLPTTLSKLGDNVFLHCTALKSITFPENLVDFWWCSSVISGCSSIETVTFLGQVTRIQSTMFYCNADYYLYANVPPFTGNGNSGTNIIERTLYVPASSVETYKTTDYWKNFSQILPLEGNSNVEKISVDESKNVRFYLSPSGIINSVPFQGINIVIFEDGSHIKIIK